MITLYVLICHILIPLCTYLYCRYNKIELSIERYDDDEWTYISYFISLSILFGGFTQSLVVIITLCYLIFKSIEKLGNRLENEGDKQRQKKAILRKIEEIKIHIANEYIADKPVKQWINKLDELENRL
jgi:hypothetical protein